MNRAPLRRLLHAPRAVVLISILWMNSWGVVTLWTILAPRTGWTAPPTTTGVATLMLTTTHVVLIAAHESGHTLAAKLLGGKFLGVHVGAFGVAVHTDWPGGMTYRERFLVSVGGPALHIAASSLVLLAALCGPDAWLVFAVGGVIGLIEASLNFLVPFSRNSDASKIYRSAWGVLRGRGGEPWFAPAQ